MADHKVCRHCGQEFDPSLGELCTAYWYHPQEAVPAGNGGTRYDYADGYRYPCCEQGWLDHPDFSEPKGCTQGVHTA